MADSCATCFFYGPNASASYPSDCRFTKPDVNPSGVNPQWPPVLSTDWCAEFSIGAKTPTPWVQFTPPLSASIGLLTSITTANAYYLINGLVGLYQFSFAINVNGTAAGKLLVGIPTQFQSGLVTSGASAIRSDTRLSCGIWYPGGPNLELTLYDGTYPGGNGAGIAGQLTFAL